MKFFWIKIFALLAFLSFFVKPDVVAAYTCCGPPSRCLANGQPDGNSNCWPCDSQCLGQDCWSYFNSRNVAAQPGCFDYIWRRQPIYGPAVEQSIRCCGPAPTPLATPSPIPSATCTPYWRCASYYGGSGPYEWDGCGNTKSQPGCSSSSTPNPTPSTSKACNASCTQFSSECTGSNQSCVNVGGPSTDFRCRDYRCPTKSDCNCSSSPTPSTKSQCSLDITPISMVSGGSVSLHWKCSDNGNPTINYIASSSPSVAGWNGYLSTDYPYETGRFEGVENVNVNQTTDFKLRCVPNEIGLINETECIKRVTIGSTPPPTTTPPTPPPPPPPPPTPPPLFPKDFRCGDSKVKETTWIAPVPCQIMTTGAGQCADDPQHPVLSPGERCDDGNLNSNDGCNPGGGACNSAALGSTSGMPNTGVTKFATVSTPVNIQAPSKPIGRPYCLTEKAITDQSGNILRYVVETTDVTKVSCQWEGDCSSMGSSNTGNSYFSVGGHTCTYRCTESPEETHYCPNAGSNLDKRPVDQLRWVYKFCIAPDPYVSCCGTTYSWTVSGTPAIETSADNSNEKTWWFRVLDLSKNVDLNKEYAKLFTVNTTFCNEIHSFRLVGVDSSPCFVPVTTTLTFAGPSFSKTRFFRCPVPYALEINAVDSAKDTDPLKLRSADDSDQSGPTSTPKATPKDIDLKVLVRCTDKTTTEEDVRINPFGANNNMVWDYGQLASCSPEIEVDGSLKLSSGTNVSDCEGRIKATIADYVFRDRFGVDGHWGPIWGARGVSIVGGDRVSEEFRYTGDVIQNPPPGFEKLLSPTGE